MLFHPYKKDFILAMIKEVETHEYISHWTLMGKGEVNNKHKNRDGKLNNILSIWYFKRKSFPDRMLMNHKSIL